MTIPPDILPTPMQTLLPSDISPSNIIGEIINSPDQYAGKQVEIVGYFHGWDLLHEMQNAPPMTRSDWVIADDSGAIYVSGLFPQGLNSSLLADTGTLLRLDATVQSNLAGLAYLEANNVEILRLWKIKFTLSGGLRGLQRVVELANTGQMTVIDQKNERQVTIQLSEEDVTKIAGLVEEAAHLPPAGQLPNCADCFVYNLNMQMDSQYFSILVNDINLAESGLAPLVNILMDLQERALSGQLK